MGKLTLKSLKRMVYKWLRVYDWRLEVIENRIIILEFQLITLKNKLEEIEQCR